MLFTAIFMHYVSYNTDNKNKKNCNSYFIYLDFKFYVIGSRKSR